jgi:hypothetical protein
LAVVTGLPVADASPEHRGVGRQWQLTHHLVESLRMRAVPAGTAVEADPADR